MLVEIFVQFYVADAGCGVCEAHVTQVVLSDVPSGPVLRLHSIKNPCMVVVL